GNVRLRDGDPLAVEGPRVLLDGAADLRTGSAKRVEHDPRPGGEEARGADVVHSQTNSNPRRKPRVFLLERSLREDIGYTFFFLFSSGFAQSWSLRSVQ